MTTIEVAYQVQIVKVFYNIALV